jgi:hypothetical protein
LILQHLNLLLLLSIIILPILLEDDCIFLQLHVELIRNQLHLLQLLQTGCVLVYLALYGGLVAALEVWVDGNEVDDLRGVMKYDLLCSCLSLNVWSMTVR